MPKLNEISIYVFKFILGVVLNILKSFYKRGACTSHKVLIPKFWVSSFGSKTKKYYHPIPSNFCYQNVSLRKLPYSHIEK